MDANPEGTMNQAATRWQAVTDAYVAKTGVPEGEAMWAMLADLLQWAVAKDINLGDVITELQDAVQYVERRG